MNVIKTNKKQVVEQPSRELLLRNKRVYILFITDYHMYQVDVYTFNLTRRAGLAFAKLCAKNAIIKHVYLPS